MGRDRNKSHDTFYACESMAYSYAGIQHYSSCYDTIAAKLIKNLGYCDTVFPSFLHTPILAADSLLGVKYFLSDTQYDGYTKLDELTVYNDQNVYYNDLALPLAFTASSAMTKIHATEDPFAYLNNIYSGLIGEKTDLFKPVVISSQPAEAENTLCFSTDKKTGSLLYLRIPEANMNASIYMDGEFVSNYRKGWMNHNVIVLGNMEQEHTIEIWNTTIEPEVVQFYSFDMDKFQRTVEMVKNASNVQNIALQNSRIEISTSGQAENVLITIPYDASWKVRVNGEIVQPQKAADAFMLIPLQENAQENTIVMEYKVKGRTLGLCTTGVSLLIFVSWGLYTWKKKKTA